MMAPDSTVRINTGQAEPLKEEADCRKGKPRGGWTENSRKKRVVTVNKRKTGGRSALESAKEAAAQGKRVKKRPKKEGGTPQQSATSFLKEKGKEKTDRKSRKHVGEDAVPPRNVDERCNRTSREETDIQRGEGKETTEDGTTPAALRTT